jgi:AraC-like DNA-binding protein
MSAHASHLVGPLLRYAREREYAADLTRYGLLADAWTRDASPITDQALGRLFDDLAIALDEPHLGLILPASLRFQRYALPELAARASATLRDAMREWTRFSALIHPAIEFTLEERGALAHLRHRMLGHPRGLSRHLNEFALAAAVHGMRETSGVGPSIVEVHFVHARPRVLGPLREFFGTSTLCFGALANELAIDAASLDRAQLTADARLLATVTALGEGALAAQPVQLDSLRTRVAAQVREQLHRGEVRIRPLARALHLSVRTLQRRLGEEGTSFAGLVDQVRQEEARALVQRSDLSLATVAAHLGFAEFATFSRAFKRWTGMAPGAYRTQSDLASVARRGASRP